MINGPAITLVYREKRSRRSPFLHLSSYCSFSYLLFCSMFYMLLITMNHLRCCKAGNFKVPRGSVIVTSFMGGRSRQARNVAVLTLCHARNYYRELMCSGDKACAPPLSNKIQTSRRSSALERHHIVVDCRKRVRSLAKLS